MLSQGERGSERVRFGKTSAELAVGFKGSNVSGMKIINERHTQTQTQTHTKCPYKVVLKCVRKQAVWEQG